MTNQELNKVINFIMKELEGYTETSIPEDTGGVTKYGISQKWNPDVDVHSLTYEEAVKIYEQKIKHFNIHKLPYDIGLFLAQWGWLCGYGTAIKYVQVALKLSCDGILGTHTYNEIISCYKMDSKPILKLFINLYEANITAVVTKNPIQKKFYKGWINRAVKTLNFLGVSDDFGM